MADADPIQRLNAALEGRYRVERELGAGGMATVYLAEDVRHHRNVALKVLKPELAAVVGADRFLAEIETTANLQHPHILPLFDSGEAGGFLFYVMPYVEGESLRERLDRENQLPVEEAVQIASKVASALDYAHGHGVIHRDIKPANILLSETGEPLVSDFGIALALNAGGGNRLTETGLSLGTPHYMSPEQATGDLNVGPQADIWALGCVLYEMLVGEPPFTGSTPQAVLGKIITVEALKVSEERRGVPLHVEATITKALEKVPADRFRSVSDLIDALAEPHFRFGTRDGARGHGGQWKWATVSLAALAAGSAVVFGVLSLAGDGDATADPVMRFDMPVSTDGQMFLGGRYPDNQWGRPATNSLAISPDGTMLVYAAWTEDDRFSSSLYVRRLEENQVYPLEGTVGAASPFFSPDGDWIGFFVGRSLRRVPSGGGTSEIIVPDVKVDRIVAWGATWGDDGTIVYGGTDGLYQVSANGGTPTLIAEADSLRYQQPEMLPGSDALLFHAASPLLPPERAEIRVLSLPSREHSVLLRDAMNPRYLRSGHLLFMRQGTLMGVAFDAVQCEVLGDPVVVLGSVMHSLFMPNMREATGAAQLDLSRAGHVVFASGGTFPGWRTEAVRVTLDGSAEVLGFDSRMFAVLRVSPDGTRVAFTAWERGSYAIYVRALDGGVAARRLDTGFRGGTDDLEWSPDGEFIAYSSPRGIERLPADGTGEPELLVAASEGRLKISSWSPRGDIAYLRGDTQDWDIWIRPAEGESFPFVASDAQERYATFSPDGRWLAYESNETGQRRVHVRPYSEPGADRIISRGSGIEPAWSPDGQSIYFHEFRDGRTILMVTGVRDDGPELSVGAPRPLIDPWPYTQTIPVRSYDMLPDGSFLAAANFELRPGERTTDLVRRQQRVDRFQLVVNFSDLLEQRLSR